MSRYAHVCETKPSFIQRSLYQLKFDQRRGDKNGQHQKDIEFIIDFGGHIWPWAALFWLKLFNISSPANLDKLYKVGLFFKFI